MTKSWQAQLPTSSRPQAASSKEHCTKVRRGVARCREAKQDTGTKDEEKREELPSKGDRQDHEYPTSRQAAHSAPGRQRSP